MDKYIEHDLNNATLQMKIAFKNILYVIGVKHKLEDKFQMSLSKYFSLALILECFKEENWKVVKTERVKDVFIIDVLSPFGELHTLQYYSKKDSILSKFYD